MKFIGNDLIANGPDPPTRRSPSEMERFREVIDKVHRYYDALGQTVLAVGGHPRGLTRTQYTGSLELFQSDIAPELRRSIPDPSWPAPVAGGGPA